MRKIQELEEVCRREGLALTVQRRLILETIAGRSDHPTVDQIFEAVKGRVPGISRTTVYRVLETFVRLGIVKRTPNLQDRARFDPNTAHHHHVVCMHCHKIVDFESGGVKRIPLPDGQDLPTFRGSTLGFLLDFGHAVGRRIDVRVGLWCGGRLTTIQDMPGCRGLFKRSSARQKKRNQLTKIAIDVNQAGLDLRRCRFS